MSCAPGLSRPLVYSLLAAVTLPVLAASPLLHAPHDTAHSVAVCKRPSGRVEVVVVSEENTLLSSKNAMVSFELITGSRLEDQTPTAVSFNPTLPWGGARTYDGQGQFLVGTTNGAWLYEPSLVGGLGPVRRYSFGIPNSAARRDVFEIASPTHDTGSPQPSFLLLTSGEVYRLRSNLKRWEQVLDTKVSTQGKSAIAMAPSFDVNGQGPNSLVFAALRQRLWVSDQAGATGTWNELPGFDDPNSDWYITAIAFDDDWGQDPDARIYMGRTRVINERETEGQILVSTDGGLTFEVKQTMDTGVYSLVSTPPGPSGNRTVLAAGRAYPNTNNSTDTGILRSLDRGETWADDGNWQSFLMEHHPGQNSGDARLARRQNFAVLPDYDTLGTVLYGRNEGLFLSEDEGGRWHEQRLRPTEDVRGLATALGPGGDLRYYAATYGGGTVFGAPDSGLLTMTEDGMSVLYQRAAAVSPNYAVDGTAFVGGASAMLAWYDPAVDPPENPFAVTGVQKLPLRHHISNDPLYKYIRTIAVSPHYDGTGQSGDQVVYFGSWANKTYYTDDGGQTYHVATTSADGPLPYFTSLAIAPTFDATVPHSDVYGLAADAVLWRMTDGVWHELGDVGDYGKVLVIDPNYDGVENRRVWIAFEGENPVVEVLDDLVNGPTVRPVAEGLPPGRCHGLAAATDAEGTWLYAGMWSEGVHRICLDRDATWSPLTIQGLPHHWLKSLALSPTWEQDRRVLVGTGAGLYAFADDGVAKSWHALFDSTIVDSLEASITTYPGAGSTAPRADQPWPWHVANRHQLPGRIFGPDAQYTIQDGAYALVRGSGRKISLYTFAGADPGAPAGSVEITVTQLKNGDELYHETVDLQSLTDEFTSWVVEIDLELTLAREVEVRLDARLDDNEVFVLDALRFEK